MYKKSAFTMVELILVIIILGIIASIGANIILKLYSNYTKTRAINRLQAQSDLVLNEIAKRLEFRIRDSAIARKTSDKTFVPLVNADNSYQILEWIGYDNDSFKALKNPGWSGFIDLNSPDTSKNIGDPGTLKTTGSNLGEADDIINALSNGEVRLKKGTPADRPALIFNNHSDFNVSQYGWGDTKGNYTYKVSYTTGTNNILNFDENTSSLHEIYEQYNLAWTAYSVVPQGDNENDFNLTLHYNYQPWEDEGYDANTTSVSVLSEHVSTFKFIQIGDTIRLKLCINDANRSGVDNFAFCKEKVVY